MMININNDKLRVNPEDAPQREKRWGSLQGLKFR